MAIELSNEMLINMKDIPPYDPKKPYYDQALSVIDFWENEKTKIRDGITIGGFFVHPWLYFILNVFKTPIPHMTSRGRSEDIITNPPLNDLIFYATESYKEAQDQNKILALFGTRGSSKSTLEAANAHWTIAAYGMGNFQVIGGNQKDLDDISSLISTTFNNVTPALFVPTLKNDWGNHVEFGYKGKANNDRRTTYANLFTTNVNSGKGEGSSEKTAGGTPIGYITDEIGKFDFWKTLEAAIPSFKTGGGFRFVPILAGTSGNSILSKDAKKALSNPEDHSILPMNWDLLNRIVPEEFITWDEDKKKKFGTFMPGQMSLRLTTPKIKSDLGTLIGNKHKDLKKISVLVTDWENAHKEIDDMTDEAKAKEKANKNKMYYPTKLAHVWLTDNPNPFPKEIIQRRIMELEDMGYEPRRVKIIKNKSKSEVSLSSKKRADVTHEGGPVDAPTLLFSELPETPPPLYVYAGGLDDYKLATANTDSLGSHYILLRRNMMPNQPCELVTCSYTSRPPVHTAFHQEIKDNIQAFSAVTLMEYIDISFEEFLERTGEASKYLAPAMTFSSAKAAKKLTRKYGLPPTDGNNQFRFKVLINWAWEQHTVDVDEEGNPVVKYSVEFIDDIDLLFEMLQWYPGKNSDRITAFSHALLLCKHWDDQKYRPKENPFIEHDHGQYEAPKPPRQRPTGITINHRVRNPYGGRR